MEPSSARRVSVLHCGILGGVIYMTSADWQRHSEHCREVAATIDDPTARRILLEAAEDYAAMATRESDVAKLKIPAYQAAGAFEAGATRQIAH